MSTTPEHPHNLDAERAVLGACLVNPKAADLAADVLEQRDFYRVQHQHVWAAIGRVRANGVPPDLVIVRDSLSGAGSLADVGEGYLAALPDGVPKSTNVEHYAGIVRRCRLERDIQAAARKQDRPAIRDALDALDALDAAADPASVAPFVSAADAETGEMIPAVVLPALAWAGAVSVIGGAPKCGKSTLIAQRIAEATCGLVAVVTEEATRMTAARLVKAGADPASVFIAPAGARGILPAIRRMEPTLLVVDSFAAFAVAVGAETLNDAAGMRRVLNQLRGVAEAGAAVLLVHHARKSDGALADSRDIAASADVVLDFYPVNRDGARCVMTNSDQRRLTAIGRWPVDPVTLDWDAAQRAYTLGNPNDAEIHDSEICT